MRKKIGISKDMCGVMYSLSNTPVFQYQLGDYMASTFEGSDFPLPTFTPFFQYLSNNVKYMDILSLSKMHDLIFDLIFHLNIKVICASC